MLLQEKHQHAMLFAGQAHANQKIPDTDVSYMVHISDVAMELLIAHKNTSDSDMLLSRCPIGGVLHKTMEDNPEITYNHIKDAFGESIAKGVLAFLKIN